MPLPGWSKASPGLFEPCSEIGLQAGIRRYGLGMHWRPGARYCPAGIVCEAAGGRFRQEAGLEIRSRYCYIMHHSLEIPPRRRKPGFRVGFPASVSHLRRQ